MKMLKAVTLTTMLAASALVATGCTKAQKGAAGGGIIGGIAGSVIGNNWVSSVGPATGATIGVTSGVAVGGLTGDAFDRMDQRDADRELQNLRAELFEKDSELAALRESGLSPDKLAELEGNRERLAQMEAELAAALANAEAGSSSLAQKEEEAKALRDSLTEAEALNADALASAEKLASETERLRAAISEKEAELAALEGRVQVLQTSLSGKEEAVEGLRKELDNINVKLEQTSRGLTLTIVDSLLYNPGVSDMSVEGKKLVGDVANILNERFPNRELLIEGHTDNQPIVHSGWKSNWELGAARALSMLHELSQHGIDASKMSATSFGEFRPNISNATPEGRRLNRRAVIVILPEELPLQRENLALAK